MTSDEKRDRQLEYFHEYNKRRRATMSEEQKTRRNARSRDNINKRRAVMTKEQRAQEREYLDRWKSVNYYGITPEQRDAMLVAQNFKCAICLTDAPGGRHDTWNTDHCHVTGHVRGLLCGKCNTGLGLFDDDWTRLQAAIAYLKRGLQ